MDAQIPERFMMADERAMLVPPDFAGGPNAPMLSSVFHRLALVIGSRIGRTAHAAFASLGDELVWAELGTVVQRHELCLYVALQQIGGSQRSAALASVKDWIQGDSSE